ncbi:hypothetical protein FJZ26_00550, partial [Candidatus Parvarchaeota archaeon]|nr:hypothetical protein [Candidatus Parvarchaeota archaeon]
MGSGGADLYIIGAVVGSIAAYFYGLGQYRLKKFIEYTPISKAVAVAPGIAEVQGIAQKASNIYTSPLQKKPCVYYRTNI